MYGHSTRSGIGLWQHGRLDHGSTMLQRVCCLLQDVLLGSNSTTWCWVCPRAVKWPVVSGGVIVVLTMHLNCCFWERKIIDDKCLCILEPFMNNLQVFWRFNGTKNVCFHNYFVLENSKHSHGMHWVRTSTSSSPKCWSQNDLPCPSTKKFHSAELRLNLFTSCV